MSLSTKTFVAAARETVPAMRAAMEDLQLDGVEATPSVSMTALIEIDGIESRVRVTVELDPETDDEA